MAEIQFKAIVELLGAPKEHLEKSMNLLVESIQKDNKNKLISKKIHPAEKSSENLFSMFADLEISVPGLAEMIGFIIDYMPSSIEILEPETIKEDSQQLTFLLNDLIQKIHQMDMSTKILLAKNRILEKELSEKK